MAKKSNIAVAVSAFVERWKDKGSEKGETQRFWLDLLHSVFNIENPMSMMQFEVPVKTFTKEKGNDFIDAYIASTRVLIEQKGSRVSLSEKARQSDGMMLTPFQQAWRYASGLPVSMTPRWIVVCNFTTFEVHDMEKPNEAPEVVLLENLEKEYYRLSFLVDDTAIHTKKEVEVSMAAGRIIGEIYDAFLKEYKNPEDPHSLRSLNILCVRLVFCLYAEDAGLFDSHSQFHDYLAQFKAGTGEMRKGLLDLFDVLNTPVAERDPYLRDDLMAFPYVNGGLFAEKDIEVPRFNERIATLLLQHASDDFDWSEISPTIFGGVFESTLNPETRRAGGMHYTSIENIHKVIDPLFLNDLKQELSDIKAEPSEKKRIAKAREFQDRLAGLKFLDPACGSGNFLTETFISLRRLENEALRIIYKGQMVMGDLVNPIKVSIGQFYGIEINDFAVSVSMTALWIAEAQMLFETEKLMQMSLDFLPLKSYTNIHEGNALRMDWNDVIDCKSVNYIFGNPPFVASTGRTDAEHGHSIGVLNDSQKEEKESILGKNGGDIDYVACWVKIASNYMKGTKCRSAFVTTNSICQGQQVAPLWGPIFADGCHIDFAWQSFKWNSEATDSAIVFVNIIGFSYLPGISRVIYDLEGKAINAGNINGYLLDLPNIEIVKSSNNLCSMPEMTKGFQVTDGGFLLLSKEEAMEMLSIDPACSEWIRPFSMGKDFIQGLERYCLWMPHIKPNEINAHPLIKKRVEACRDWRSSQVKSGDAYKLKDIPTQFRPLSKFKDTVYIAVPLVSSCNRDYIPIGFVTDGRIPGNQLFFLPDVGNFEFGVLTSFVHNAWIHVVGSKFGPSYRYSNTIVYNNFPWPTPTDAQKAKIEQTAQAILDARALYPDSSLADLYDDLTMPIELRKAHRANDAAVMEAYGFRKDMTEPEIVAELFKMYQNLTKK